MTREEAIKELNSVFEPAYANYIVIALTEGATVSDKTEQEPCNDIGRYDPYTDTFVKDDCIRRQAVIDYECNFICGEGIRCVSGCSNINGIKKLPAVQPKVKTGKWVKSRSGWFVYDCSCCGRHTDHSTNYCPNCGAKMEAK